MNMSLNPIEKKSIYLLFFLVPFLLGTCIDLYVPSLPAITHYFACSPSQAQLSVPCYMLGYGIGQIFLGVLSDRYGRRKILIGPGLVFAVASFIAANATSIHMLMLCRLLQGLAIAGPGVVFRAIATDCFSGKDMTKAITCISISWSFGPIIGPFIGGYLQHYFNWQAGFYYFALFGLFTFIYAYFFLPETHQHRTSLHPKKILQNIIQIMTHPVFIVYATINALLYAMVVIFNVIGPFLIQDHLHYSATDYGQIALILGISGLSGNLLNRFLINHFSVQPIVLLTLLFDLILSFIMIFVGLWLPPSLHWILITSVLLFAAGGIASPNVAAACFNLFPKAAGTASALFGSLLALQIFLISSLASLLPTQSQTPMGLVYFVISSICLVLFLIGKKFKKNS